MANYEAEKSKRTTFKEHNMDKDALVLDFAFTLKKRLSFLRESNRREYPYQLSLVMGILWIIWSLGIK